MKKIAKAIMLICRLAWQNYGKVLLIEAIVFLVSFPGAEESRRDAHFVISGPSIRILPDVLFANFLYLNLILILLMLAVMAYGRRK